MRELGIGAQLFTVRENTKTLEEVAKTFHRVREIGYQAVQISAFGPMNAENVGKLAKRNDLKIVATHFNWSEFLNEIDQVIASHEAWDCSHSAIGGLPKEYFTEDGLNQFIKELPPITEKLNSHGIDFSYHNHSHELFRYGRTTWLKKLYQSIPSNILKAELDLYWLTAGGADPAQWISDIGKRQPLIHFKDMCVLHDRTQRFAEVGEGNLNWDRILKACKKVNVEWALIEQDETYGKDPFKCLARSFQNIKKMN